MVDPKQQTEEQIRLQKTLDELLKKNSDQIAIQIAENQKINKLYKSRLDSEVKLADFSEIIAQNNKIARLEAQSAARTVEENLNRQIKFAQEDLEYQNQITEALEKKRKKEEEIKKLGMKIAYARIAGNDDEINSNIAIIKQEQQKLEQIKKQVKAGRAKKQEFLQERQEQQGKDKRSLSLQVQKRNTLIQTNKANENLQSSTRGFLKTFTGVTDMSDSFLGSLINSDDAVGQIGDTMKATLTGPNMAFSVLSKIFQSTLHFMKEFDKLASDFRKNTGIIERGFGGIEQRIVNVQRANIRMGVSMDEAFQAAGSLTSEMASFTGMTDKSQASVLQAATVLQEFGVGAQTTAQIFNNFSKGLGYNANQLEKLSTQLMGISTSLKIPPQIIATEFNAASKELMKYGGDMVNVFKGIAEQSKQTGIAMGELLGIVKQFDTFEGAGAAVGKLNAILGGPYLNSINMLYATEEDRVKMLRESVALSGKQFNQLSRFEQQAIAAAAGITDMTVAARLFGGTSSEFAKTQMSMKEMQERAAKAQSVQEKFTQVMQSFAIALGPVVTALGAVVDALVVIMNPFTEIMNFGSTIGPMLNGITVSLLATVVALKVFGAASIIAFAPWVAGIAVFVIAINLLQDLAPGLRIAAGALFLLAGSLLAVWAGLVLVGALLSGGTLLVPALGMAAGVGLAAAGLVGTISGVSDSFESGKSPGQPVRNNRGLVSENGEEMVVTADGRAHLVTEPSVIELGTQDTVYTNAETKAMLSNGSSNDSGAAIAEMRQMIGELARSQQQQSAAADRRVEAMLDRPVVVAVNDKKLFETMKPQLNRALGLSRTGGVV